MHERASAQAAIEQIASRQPKALGVAMDLRARDGARLRSSDDPRGAVLEGLAIAVLDDERDDPGASTVFWLERELLAAMSAPEGLAMSAPEGLARLLRSLWGAPYVIFANAHRALSALRDHGVPSPSRFGCAMVAATLLAEGSDRRRDHRPLDRSVRELLQLELPEDLLLAGTIRERLACEAEAVVTLLRAMTPSLRERGLAKVYSFECSLLPAVVDMEAAGFGIDPAAFERVASSWVRERTEFEHEAPPEGRSEHEAPPEGRSHEAPPEGRSAGSAAEHEAPPEGRATGPGFVAPEGRAARIARLDKLISTYRYWARDFVGADRRIHARLHPLAADSGRFSCTDPNLQQVPAEHTAPGLRACFVPAPGNLLVIADYAQIELRVAAHLAPCAALREVFQAGRDPHAATAATLANKPEHEIDKHERKLAKAVNFGFLFGMGAKRFQSYARSSYGLELDERAAAAAREAFFRTFPGIAAWHRRIGALSRRAEREPITVTTAMGRRRSFPAGSFSFNAALNIPVQGTAAEGFKLAMLRLHPALAELGGRGVLVVHDEYIAELPAQHAERGRELVERIMVESMRELIDTVPIVVEAEIAPHWK